MQNPVQFIRRKQSEKIEKLIAEVIRISEAGGKSTPRNDEVSNIPISTYRTMLSDDEVKANLRLKEVLALPVLNILPPNSDEKAKKSALFIEQIHRDMQGSPLTYYRDQAYHETQIAGFVLMEPDYYDTVLPDFGKVRGVRGFTIGNSEDFAGKTVMDEYGRIEKFVQDRAGSQDLFPEEVAYYGYQAISGNPEGISALFPAHRFWELKKRILTKLEIFAAVNAAGIQKMKIPPALFKKEKADALVLLEELAGTGYIAMPSNWELAFEAPPKEAGGQFISIIQEVCNKAIRKSILFDDTVSAEGMHTWGEAGKEATQSMVAEIMRSEGEEFCDSFLSDQVFRMILDENGMQSYPTPIASNTSARKQGDPIQILTALGTAKQTQVLTIPITETFQQQIVALMADSIGIEYTAVVEEELDEDPDDTLLKRSRFERNAPRGRSKSDTLKQKKPMKKRAQNAAEETAAVWTSLIPKISDRLNTALFQGEDWKSTNLGRIRDEIKKAITYGGKDLREVMFNHTLAEHEIGMEEAESVLKVRARVSTGPRINPRMAVQSLQQRVYLTLEKTYGQLAGDLYFRIEAAVMGTTSSIEAQAIIERYLLEEGITIGRASTVLNTAMAHAYNGGRMTVFSPLQDPFGSTPGSIIGYKYSAVLDDHTSDLCEDLNGEFFRCNDSSLPKPPLHMNCRSQLIPVFDDEEPWDNRDWVEPNETSRIIADHGGIPEGFGG